MRDSGWYSDPDYDCSGERLDRSERNYDADCDRLMEAQEIQREARLVLSYIPSFKGDRHAPAL
jgi:hypothetical protein